MKKGNRKIVALCLSVIMLMSCGIATAEIEVIGWEKPEETLVFSAYKGQGDPESFKADREETGWAMANWLKENMNVQLDIQVFMDAQEQRVSLMLLAGDYPDVLAYTTEAASSLFIDSGNALELTELLNTHGQNILAEFGPYIELFKNEDGEIYRLPSHWGYKVDSDIALSFSIRYDWWKELGVELYTTPEEYYEQIKAVLANHPTNENGEKVYAFTDFGGGSILETMLGAWGFIDGYKVDADNNMTHWLLTDEAAELVEYANRFWREGMIDPDFVTNEFDDWKAMGTNERTAGDLGAWWRTFVCGHEYWQWEDPETPLDKRYLNAKVKADGVEKDTLATKNMLCTDLANGAYWLITNNCKNPEGVMDYLNWEMSPQGTMFVQYGWPDEANIYDLIDGKVVFKDTALDASNKNAGFHLVMKYFDPSAYWLITRRNCVNEGVLPFPYEIDERCIWSNWGTGDVYPKTPDGSRYLDDGWEICWGSYDMDTSIDTTMFNYTCNADDPIYTINQNVRDQVNTYWIKLITAETAEGCQAMLAEARNAIIQAGAEQLQQYRTDAYKTNIKKVADAAK